MQLPDNIRWLDKHRPQLNSTLFHNSWLATLPPLYWLPPAFRLIPPYPPSGGGKHSPVDGCGRGVDVVL
jgi:hypothetical protein